MKTGEKRIKTKQKTTATKMQPTDVLPNLGSLAMLMFGPYPVTPMYSPGPTLLGQFALLNARISVAMTRPLRRQLVLLKEAAMPRGPEKHVVHMLGARQADATLVLVSVSHM
jgi:hypothetical protein